MAKHPSPRTNLPDIFDGLAIMHEDEDFSDLIIDEMWAMSDTEEDGTRFVARSPTHPPWS